MNIEQRENGALQYLVVLPDAYDPLLQYPKLVLLHGFGASMRDLAGLAPAISSKDYVYLCPNAPIAFDIGAGQTGFGWYTPRSENSSDEIKEAEILLGSFFSNALGEFGESSKALLLGFSQGGGMSLRCGIGRPDSFVGLGILSPHLPNPFALEERLPLGRSQEIFLSHGSDDNLIPIAETRAIRDYLGAVGYAPAYHEYPIGHELTPDVIRDLGSWIGRLLPSLEQRKE